MEEERSSRAPIDLAIFQSLELKSIELTQQLNEQVASIQQQMNKVRKQPKCGETILKWVGQLDVNIYGSGWKSI
jgi:hypothetical protein